VWVAFKAENQHGIIWRLDGETGEVLDEVEGPLWPSDDGRGPYGGAVDAEGNFWVTGFDIVLRVDALTLAVQDVGPAPSYGMAMDAEGDVWTAAWTGEISHYDAATGKWMQLKGTESVLRGLQIDKAGHGWVAAKDPCRLVKFDVAAEELIDGNIELPECVDPVGVSIDVEGYVWIVDAGANLAYKIDPDDHSVVTTVGNLQTPYTYSDMTGAGLDLVLNPSG
jgi:streptogramin lyase